MTTGLAAPKGPLIKLTTTAGIITTIPRTRKVAKVLSHLRATSSRLLPMLSKTPLFSISRTGMASENMIERIIPGTTNAMVPRMTITPTMMLRAQIESSLEVAYLTDCQRSAWAFSICSDACLMAPP